MYLVSRLSAAVVTITALELYVKYMLCIIHVNVKMTFYLKTNQLYSYFMLLKILFIPEVLKLLRLYLWHPLKIVCVSWNPNVFNFNLTPNFLKKKKG